MTNFVPPSQAPTPALALSVFASPQRWWLRRECPPPLRDERLWVRVLRACLLLGAMGMALGWLSAVLLMLNGLVRIHEEGLFWMPGAVFGVAVLIPLSRWSGRNWFAALFAVPMSTVAYWVAVYVYIENAPLFGSGGLVRWLAGALGGITGMAILCLWMAPLRAGRWLGVLIPVGLLAGALGGAITGYALNLHRTSSWFPAFDAVMELGYTSLAFAPFQALVAMALGMRLWKPPAIEVTVMPESEALPS